MQRDSVDVDHIFMNDEEDKKLDSLPRDKSYKDTKHTVFQNRSSSLTFTTFRRRERSVATFPCLNFRAKIQIVELYL